MERSLERLADDIIGAAGDLEAAMCRWLGLVAEFDRREGWAAEGCASCSAWVAWRCGLSAAAARERVRIARRLEELPVVRETFARGELTYSKVRALTRIDDVEREDEPVEFALTTTASQLERAVGAYRGVVRAEQGADRSYAERFLSWHHDDDGSLVVRGRLPAEDGAALVRAIEAIRDERLRCASAEAGAAPAQASSDRELASAAAVAEAAPGAEADDPVAARNADALVALVESGVAAAEADRTGGERFQVVVHVDAEALADPHGHAEIEHGPPAAAETARRLACDSAVVGLVEREGRPLTVGRRTRSIPPALRRALRARDGGCQFPGCDRHRHVDAHHVEHWAHGGETKLSNLVLLCRHHHRLVHEGGFTIELAGDTVRVRRPDGRPLPPRRRRRGDCADLPPRASAEAPLQWTVEPMDLGLAVDAVLAFAPPGRLPRRDSA